jgi:hypothetical protein
MRVCTNTVRAFASALVLFALGLMAQPAGAQQTFSYPNFNSTTGLTLNGTPAPTSVGSPAVLRLTKASGTQVGSTWYSTTMPLVAGFTTTFTFQFSSPGGDGNGADGIAFVVQHSSLGNGWFDSNSGGAIGYGDDDADTLFNGVSNSVAIEFDSYQNGWDPNNNHIAIQSCGTVANSQHHGGLCAGVANTNSTIAITLPTTPLPNFKDGNPHTAVITYNPPSSGVKNLTVTLDGVSVLAATFDIASLGLDANADAFVGFTGSTGGGWENQDIVSWSFSSQTITQPISSSAPTNFNFSNTQGSELTHTVDFTPPAGQLVYPNDDPGTLQIQSTNTSVANTTWPQYVVGGPFAPSLLFPIVEDNTNGGTANGALFVDLCFDPSKSGSAATPSDANCPFVPASSPASTPLLAINVVADLATKPNILPGTTTALAHYEPTAPSNTPWGPSTTSPNPACVATTGASGGTQPAPPSACNTFDAQNVISGDQTTSSGRSRSKGTFAMIYQVPMLLSTVTVNGTPVNIPPANGSAYVPLPVTGTQWFSSPLTINFNVSPACIPTACPYVAGAPGNTNNFTAAPVAGESFNILAGLPPGTTSVLPNPMTANGLTPVNPPSTFDTASVRPILFTQGQTLSDGQYTLEWSAVDNVGIQEQNQNLIPPPPSGVCPGTDPAASGPQCYVTTLFNAPLNVDSTPPAIAYTTQTFTAGQKNAVPTISCSDTESGVASCVANNGAPLNTTPTSGVLTQKTFTAVATDKAIPPNTYMNTYTYNVSCNYAAVTLSTSSLSKSKLPTLIGITASVTDCMTASQKVVVNFSVSGPIGKNCAIATQSLFTTPAFTIKSGTASSVTFPFPILKGACTTAPYNIITTTTIPGSNQPPDVVSSQLTITN